MKKLLKTFLRGMFMGAADIVPGVSGGTIALVTGIYERFILAINNLLDIIVIGLKLIFQKNSRKDLRPKLREAVKNNDAKFLATLATGGTISFLIISRFILNAMQSHPSYIFSFFSGLILASAVMIYGHIKKPGWKLMATGVLGFLISLAVSSFNTLGTTHALPVIFFSGFFGVCAMLLPGISGSFVLLILGQYEHMLSVLKNLEVLTIFVFVTGMAAGGLLMSKVVSYFLKNHEQKTISFLVGLMLGGLYLPLKNVVSSQTVWSPVTILGVGLSGILGILLVNALERMK